VNAKQDIALVLVAAACILLIGSIGYQLGKTDGVAEGRRQASDEVYDANICADAAIDTAISTAQRAQGGK
jgi:hypothetical protein